MLTLGEEYVSVPEAAAILNVSPSTIWRWIDRGDLPASRIGRRRVVVRRDDVAKAVRPARGMTATEPADDPRLKLSLAEREAIRIAMERGRALRERLLARRGGRPFPPSWELINEMRDERSRDVEP